MELRSAADCYALEVEQISSKELVVAILPTQRRKMVCIYLKPICRRNKDLDLDRSKNLDPGMDLGLDQGLDPGLLLGLDQDLDLDGILVLDRDSDLVPASVGVPMMSEDEGKADLVPSKLSPVVVPSSAMGSEGPQVSSLVSSVGVSASPSFLPVETFDSPMVAPIYLGTVGEGENLGPAGEGTSANLLRREEEEAGSLSVDVGFGSLSGSFGSVYNDGSVSAWVSDLLVPKSQPLVNGLTEAQAWFFGWMRQGGWNHENLLAAVDRFEEQTRRDNEVAPSLDCSMELP